MGPMSPVRADPHWVGLCPVKLTNQIKSFPIKSDNWTSKKAGPVLEPFQSKMDLSPCKHLDQFLLVLAAQLSLGTS